MKELLVFKMPNCAPCKQLESILKDIQNVRLINVMDNMEEAEKYSIRKAPTVIIIEDGEEADRFTGVKTREEILSYLE